MAQIVTCCYEPGTPAEIIEAAKPYPFPGSVEARDIGCTCPEEQIWPRGLVLHTGCPVEAHQIVHYRPN